MTKQQRGQERREAILAAADVLFRQQGYAATSMRQIAEAAGYGSAVSGLYNHFANKEAIFEALLISRSPYQDLLAALEQVEGETFEVFLHNWFSALWPIMLAHQNFLQLVFIELQEFEGRTLGRFLGTFLPRYFELFMRITHMPRVRQDLPLPVLVRTVAAAMIGYLLTEIVAREAIKDSPAFPMAVGEEWIDGLVAILVRGMSNLPDDGGPSTEGDQHD
ncbi:MAG: TetR/AcrR family transcriptional regulator [Anaerolineae bacterium]|nr:TetR/AcrR family transcriptional regulator [Anaerolineae bacterium]